jgi:hypothetical protein
LHIILRGIGYHRVTPLTNPSHRAITRELQSVIKLYTVQGFNVADIHTDHEFEYIYNKITPITFDIIPANAHVGELRSSIYTIKERLHSSLHDLPFKRIPHILIHNMVYDVVHCLNVFPWAIAISSTL